MTNPSPTAKIPGLAPGLVLAKRCLNLCACWLPSYLQYRVLSYAVIATCSLLGTEDTHLQEVGAPWGYQGDGHVVATPVDGLEKRATAMSSGEEWGQAEGEKGI